MFKEIYYFLSSKIFLTGFAKMLGAIAGVFLLTFWGLKCYTHHGDSIEVPGLTNKDINEVMKIADNRDLQIFINDSIWQGDKPGGIVVEQDPDSASMVKENRTIYLTITKYTPDDVELPALDGSDNFNYYAHVLKQRDLKLEIRSKEFDNKLEENTILYLYVGDKKITAKDLEEGINVPQGTTIFAVVATKGGAQVDIPYLICKKFSEAEFLVTGSKLNIGSIIPDETVTSQENAYVWKQDPEYLPDKTLLEGTSIDIYITKRLPEECEEDN